MSRIHEALRKAEQERAANTLAGSATPASPSVTPAGVAVEGPAVEMPDLNLLATGAEVLTPEALQTRCPQSMWNPPPGSTLFADLQDHSLGTEEFRSLRSRLYQIREKQPLQILLVASSVSGEGKTFVAVNLARAIVQQHGRRVLLIDTDLRISQMYGFLGAQPGPGLSDYLLGEVDIFSALQRGQQDGLFFVAGGKTVPNPVELIGSGRLKILLQRLAPAFDWIVLDSPPAVPVTDASLLAEMCDGVLMVVKANETPYDIAQKGRQQFRGKPVIGVVLNRAAQGSTYSAYYHYYSGDGKTNKRRKRG